MSLIGKEIKDFTVKAYHDGEIETVTKQDVLGKWSLFFWLFGGFCGRDSGIGPAQRAKTTIWN